ASDAESKAAPDTQAWGWLECGIRCSTCPVPAQMFWRTGPHKFRRCALSRSSQRLGCFPGCESAIRGVALSDLAEEAPDVARRVSGFRERGQCRPFPRRLGGASLRPGAIQK